MLAMTDKPETPRTREFMDVQEVAEILQLHPNTVRRMIKQGDIPGGVRIGRHHRVNRKTFEEAMKG